MEWTDEGIILSVNPHGENHAIVDIFTPEAGRVAAIVHGGQGKTKQSMIQPGNLVKATWKGKSENAMGHFTAEMMTPYAAQYMYGRDSLRALSSICALLHICLPEKQSVPKLYNASKLVIDLLGEKDIWPIIYCKWELGLLDALGYGLTLDRCVASGMALEDGAELCFVSPKSGGAVSYKEGMPYKNRMLPLPSFLIDMGDPTRQEIPAALALTGYFIEQRVLHPVQKQLPEARQELARRFK